VAGRLIDARRLAALRPWRQVDHIGITASDRLDQLFKAESLSGSAAYASFGPGRYGVVTISQRSMRGLNMSCREKS
jgi:hypothetical protein